MREAVVADCSEGGTSAALTITATMEAAAQPRSTVFNLSTFFGFLGARETGLMDVGLTKNLIAPLSVWSNLRSPLLR
jgi:hypothetical protein